MAVIVVLMNHLHKSGRVHDSSAVLCGSPNQPVVISGAPNRKRWDCREQIACENKVVDTQIATGSSVGNGTRGQAFVPVVVKLEELIDFKVDPPSN